MFADQDPKNMVDNRTQKNEEENMLKLPIFTCKNVTFNASSDLFLSGNC